MGIILETDRLILRQWTLADLVAHFELCSDADVMRYIGDGRAFSTVVQSRAWIEKAMAAYERDGFGRWAAVDKAHDTIVGSCGFSCVDADALIDLSFLFARDYWGRGLATEAASACLQFGFERLSFPEVTARIAPQHSASRRVLEKIGFAYQGITHDRRDEEADAVYVARNPYAGAL